MIRVFTILFLFMVSLPALAQQPDNYSDYSYLWENSKEALKAKKKAEKQRLKELKKLQKSGSIPTDVTPADTTQNPAENLNVSADSTTVPQDSLQQESVTLSDSLQTQPKDSLQTQPTDSFQQEALSETEIATDSLEQSTTPEKVDGQSKGEPQEPVIETPIEEKAPEVEDLEPAVEETTEGIPLEEETIVEDPSAEEETPIKPKEKKKVAPMGDFRSGLPNSSPSQVNAGLTFTQIDGQNYVGMILNPEFSIGKVGVGLNVPILYGLDDQKVRTDIFEDGVGAARLITYLRYGVQKRDPVYFRVGQLDGISIGFGGLVNNYTNSTSLEKRKLGLHLDFNWRGLGGIEAMYSDFDPASQNLLVIRPYARPLATTGIPIIRTFEIGATFASDKDQTSIASTDSTSTSYALTEDGISAFGIDAGFTVWKIPFIQVDAFFTYSKLSLLKGGLSDSLSVLAQTDDRLILRNYADGSGWSYGMNFRLNFIADLFHTDIRIERLSYSQHFIPQFFDFNYELNKDTRIFSTVGAEKKSGIYGSLTGHILQKVRLGGSLLIPDNVSETAPAVIQLNATVDRLANKFSIHALYLKGGLADLSDAFKLDERSIAKVRFAYHMNNWLVVGTDYYWAFTPTADGSIEATEYVSPYIGVSIQF
ncbi:MAG: hypothetical protein R8G66_27885 [Cytophagales bacterium]|nr:hypothetical protein [Cytophagales bacterium]